MQDTRFLAQLLYPPQPGMANTTTHYFYAQPPSYAYAPQDTAPYAPNAYTSVGYPYSSYVPPAQQPMYPPTNNYPKPHKPKHKGATLRKKRRPKPSSSLGRTAYNQHTLRDTQIPGSIARRTRGRTLRGPDAAAYAQAVQYLKSIGVATGPGPSSAYLNRKPRSWRGGYKPPSTKKTLGSYFSRPFKMGSFLPRSQTFSSRQFQLNRALAHRPYGVSQSIAVDLRSDPQRDLRGTGIDPSINLHMPATSPPVPRMHIWHKSLPWYINIESSASAASSSSASPYVTVLDVLTGIHAELARPIVSHEYYNTLLTSADREALALAFQRRCHGDLSLITKGICRVDFLGLGSNGVEADRVWFAGLEEVRDGMWELKTTPRVTRRGQERMIIE
ncbi:hypothetical protein D9619_013501 [Psilocybe cf. subviscida]|uniref:DUF6699 domain-containing protein n=1 Tax=Psilocybe cf. subviscida TaxID=2480587 RepID=A0A8H5F4S1_9AGAR|nr:hypothetical protein D9619_013501 [Psilocybe cf. subviscida]